MREVAVPPSKSGGSGPVPLQQKLSNLFQQIDTAGKGSITKTQFEQAFNKLNPPAAAKAIGAEATFSKLDPGGTGSVSKQDFIKGMSALMARTPPKEAAAKAAVAAPAHKAQTGSITSVNAPASAPAPVASAAPAANGSIGNTINIAA